MQITLQPYETMWNTNGTHLLDDKGISIICEQETVITFDSQEIYDMALIAIQSERERTGRDIVTGLFPSVC